MFGYHSSKLTQVSSSSWLFRTSDRGLSQPLECSDRLIRLLSYKAWACLFCFPTGIDFINVMEVGRTLFRNPSSKLTQVSSPLSAACHNFFILAIEDCQPHGMSASVCPSIKLVLCCLALFNLNHILPNPILSRTK